MLYSNSGTAYKEEKLIRSVRKILFKVRNQPIQCHITYTVKFIIITPSVSFNDLQKANLIQRLNRYGMVNNTLNSVSIHIKKPSAFPLWVFGLYFLAYSLSLIIVWIYRKDTIMEYSAYIAMLIYSYI